VRTGHTTAIQLPRDEGRFNFTEYVMDRTRDFTGREWLFQKLDAWLRDPEAPPHFLITAEPGVGKTALAARLLQIWPTRISAYHFCAATRGEWIDPAAFARSIALQLIDRFDEYSKLILAQEGATHYEATVVANTLVNSKAVGILIEQFPISDAATMFNRLVRAPLRNLRRTDASAPIVILVDALDESLSVPGGPTIADLLSSTRDERYGVRWLLTSREEPRVVRHWQGGNVLRIVSRELQNREDLEKYVDLRIERMRERQPRLFLSASPERLQTKVNVEAAGNFLYAVFFLNFFEEDPDRAINADLPPGLDGVYRMFLDNRLISRDLINYRTRVLPVLGSIAVAREPVSERQISDWTGLPGETVATALLELQEYLPIEAIGDRVVRIYHKSFSDFITNRERAKHLAVDRRSASARIVNWYSARCSRLVDSARIDAYALAHLTTHLDEAGAARTLLTSYLRPSGKRDRCQRAHGDSTQAMSTSPCEVPLACRTSTCRWSWRWHCFPLV
jgi:hypothetical protein